MGTDDILGKANDEPAAVAEDQLDEAAATIDHETADADQPPAAEPSVTEDSNE